MSTNKAMTAFTAGQAAAAGAMIAGEGMVPLVDAGFMGCYEMVPAAYRKRYKGQARDFWCGWNDTVREVVEHGRGALAILYELY